MTVVLRGKKGETGRCLLSKTERDFERGTTDSFVVEAEDVGPLTAVTIGHDNCGFRPSWHLDQVKVRDATGETPAVCFPCRAWLDADTGDRTTMRTLAPGAVRADVSYTVVVTTSDERGAGTESRSGPPFWNPAHIVRTHRLACELRDIVSIRGIRRLKAAGGGAPLHPSTSKGLFCIVPPPCHTL